MKICIITMLRFHLFNQADELGKIRENDIELYTSWNARSAQKRFSLQHIKIYGYWFFGGLLYITQKIPITYIRSFFLKIINFYFARYAFTRLPNNVKKVIFCSTHLFPNIGLIKNIKSEIIVDHGSLHPNYEANLMSNENKIFNFKKSGNEEKAWINNWLRLEFDSADKIFVCSELAKRTFIIEGVPEKKIYVNKLGVNLKEFSLSYHRSYDINKLNVNILCVGAVIPRKGIHRLIDALKLIDEYNFTINCVGTSPKDKALIKILDNPGKNISVVLTGPVDQSKLNEFYLKTDLFILSSICDGFGMVTPQAMATKTVCIISSNAGSHELINDNKNGFIISDVRNAKSYSQLVSKVLNLDANERKKIAEEASKTVSRLAGWSGYGASVQKNLIKNDD